MAREYFSKRTGWDLQGNALNQMLEELKSGGVDITDLTETNPTKCGFIYPPEILSSLSLARNLVYAPDPRGMSVAREAVGVFRGFDAGRILLTASTSESYMFLFRLLLDPGDKVLIPRPSYPLFEFLLELNDASFTHYPLVYREGAWSMDFKTLESLIDAKTKAIIVVNPNNPTGSYIKEDELRTLNVFCRAHALTIISDEVFFDYRLTQGPFVSFKGNADVLTFVLEGLSKSVGLPQMKVGWILANGPGQMVDEALNRLEIIADTYLSVNTPAQNALGPWLSHAKDLQGQILERVKTNWACLRACGIDVLTVEGGWCAVVRREVMDEEGFVLNLLREHHVMVHPGYFFNFEQSGYFVVSLLPKPEQFVKIIRFLGGV